MRSNQLSYPATGRWILRATVADVLLADVPPPVPATAAAVVVAAGRSVEGRPLRVTRRGAADAPRRVLVVGAVHGDEPGGRRIVAALRERPAPAGTAIYAIADLNPDGARRRTRTNARGVDLNRNFPGDWRAAPRGRYFPGPRPSSEPETTWARRAITAVRPDVTVWFHQPYGLVNLSSAADRALVRGYARRVGLPLRRLPRLRGTAIGWQRLRFPDADAFVVELGPRRPGAAEVDRHVRAIHALAAEPE